MRGSVMREQLRALYEPALDFMRREATQYSDVSHPLLISVPKGYAESATRLMVVGQETHGWGPTQLSKSTLGVDAILRMYEQFDMGARYVRSPFWQAAREMQLALNRTSPTGAFIWTNVNKLDMARRRIPASLEARLDANDLLLAEIQITDPQVILFFTGPRYDDRLRTLLRGVKLNPASGTGLEHVSRVEHERLPKRSFRTYHPAYLRRSRQWPTLARLLPHLQTDEPRSSDSLRL